MSNNSKRGGPASTCISFGCILATVVSYCTWKSIWWAMLHGALGWFYIIYFMIKY